MKRILIPFMMLLACAPGEAGKARRAAKLCYVQQMCCRNSSYGPTTKYWKGKDGEIRETITHWEALHRSVEAEHLEKEVAEVRTELTSAKAEVSKTKQQLAEAKASAAAERDQLMQEIAAQ